MEAISSLKAANFNVDLKSNPGLPRMISFEADDSQSRSRNCWMSGEYTSTVPRFERRSRAVLSLNAYRHILFSYWHLDGVLQHYHSAGRVCFHTQR